MKNKGPIWAIIFFAILVFILVNTLNTQSYFYSTDLDITSDDGFVADTTITNINHPLEQEGTLYQQFHLETDDRPNTATLSVDDTWLRHEGVSASSVRLYYQKRNGDPWEEKELTNMLSFSDSTSYTVHDMNTGNYYIMGEAGTASVPEPPLDIKTQLGLLIAIIILLLFIAYHHNSSREERHHEKQKPGQEQLDRYVRESLLSGHDEEAVKERLERAGWSDKQVDQSLRRARLL